MTVSDPPRDLDLARPWARAADELLDELAVIGVVVLVNAFIGFVTELRAVRAMEGLARLSQTRSRVRRGGKARMVPADRLVPGGIVVLEAGDTVAADLRVLESARLEVDESTLTGESQPVAKQAGPVSGDATLAERASMLFKGTAVIGGSGEGLVIATGMDTELGGIARDIREAEGETTPLEDRLDQLGRSFIWLTVLLSVLVVAAGWLQGRDLLLVVQSGVALAVAAIPEGLPIVATIALARGMRRMADRNALVNRLSAVETLGATTFTLVSLEIYAQVSAAGADSAARVDPMRLIEGIIGGIGFLGAGAIIRGQGSVAGLTTAGSLWFVGSVGVAIGGAST